MLLLYAHVLADVLADIPEESDGDFPVAIVVVLVLAVVVAAILLMVRRRRRGG